jgi:predicted glycogen debranching enzyme
MPLYRIDTFGELAPFNQREWLLTNGLGGYASSTVVGCNIRKYHGLLIAATKPPVGRIATLSRLGEMLVFDDDPQHPHELAVNQFRDNVHPHGERYLQRFELGEVAAWHYDVNGVAVTKELLIPWKINAAGVRYTIDSGSRALEFRNWPFFAMRDFHSTRHANGYDLPNEIRDDGVSVTVDGQSLHVRGDGAGKFVKEPSWWYGHVYPIETERGQDDSEDLFTPGRFTLRVMGKTVLTIWATLDARNECDWAAQVLRRKEAIDSATRAQMPVERQRNVTVSSALTKLARAANDFVVDRKSPDGKDGTSIIAGYPWFADWGRDTFISLPGLLLTTGRFEDAKRVLSVFAQHVSEGMIPNRFDDYTNEPHYNTVDASLWFIHAAHEYVRLSNDRATFDAVLRPACRAILDGYRRGTRFGIQMDEADGLITQGDAHTQLTWMDAKCGDEAFTPRQGKPVEINALWYHALMLMGESAPAARVRDSFAKAFWISPFRGLADVVEGGRDGYKRDNSIRPNQIFAASLPNSPLTREQQHAVVEVVRRELLTPVGLRSLARSDPKYQGRYIGIQYERDRAYHNGTIWAWLIGAFLDGYLRVHDRSEEAVAQARRWLSPLIDHLEDEACIGQISEIFEADEPHRAVGCCAQAWSVAEVLRLAVELGM